MRTRLIFIALACLMSGKLQACLAQPVPPAPAEDRAASTEAAEFETITIRGRFVWLAEALERRFGITTVPEAHDRVMALETFDGQLVPLAEDIRGRAFRNDERLRKLADCELLVRRYQSSPVVQIIRLYSHEDGGKVELDYYCEICAITLFELKPCDCCQGPIELRRRPAGPSPAR